MSEAPAETEVERLDVRAVDRTARRSLYQRRVKIHPKRARGTFRRLKWVVMALTLSVYYLVPWIRWDRGANAPDQAVLIDFPARRFYFFFIEIWPQEIYYITGLLIVAALALFLVTSVAGRVWCGYTCPQTVWTDLFVAVERWVEGDRGARIRLDKARWTAGKLGKRVVKHAIWIVIAMATGGAWIFYFADAPTLAARLATFDAPPVAYITIAVLTFTTYMLGGLAREQVCIYMCPWPRIQGAMIDADSLLVTYRDYRGEPRRAFRKGESWEGRGDCIDCNQCVAVCPMGIDIRDGQQLECISCALCIDACDWVMDSIARPRGLIAYDTLANQARRATGKAAHVSLFRPRTLVYAIIIVATAAIMVFGLGTRASLDVNVLRERNPLFVTLSDGGIRNTYTLKIINKQHEARTYRLGIEGLDRAMIAVLGRDEGAAPTFTVKPDSLASFRLFLTAPRAALEDESTAIRFVISDVADDTEAGYDSVFLGPGT